MFACCNFVYYISIIGCLFQVILSNLEPDESIPDDDEGVAVSLKKVKLSSSSSAFTDVSDDSVKLWGVDTQGMKILSEQFPTGQCAWFS